MNLRRSNEGIFVN